MIEEIITRHKTIFFANLSQLFQLVKSIEEFWLLSTTLTLDLEKQNREL